MTHPKTFALQPLHFNLCTSTFALQPLHFNLCTSTFALQIPRPKPQTQPPAPCTLLTPHAQGASLLP
jgi:hypothetical protein